MATDRLALAHALEEGGIARAAAERISTEIFDAIHDNVATKADVAAVRADLRELEQRLDRRIDQMVMRLGAVVVVVAGVLFTALHYWPPHG